MLTVFSFLGCCSTSTRKGPNRLRNGCYESFSTPEATSLPLSAVVVGVHLLRVGDVERDDQLASLYALRRGFAVLGVQAEPAIVERLELVVPFVLQ